MYGSSRRLWMQVWQWRRVRGSGERLEPLGTLLLKARIPAPIVVMPHTRMSTLLTRLHHGAIQPMNRLPTAAAEQRFPQSHGAYTSCLLLTICQCVNGYFVGRYRAHIIPAKTIEENHWK